MSKFNSVLSRLSISALVFVHLKDPDTRKPLYRQKEIDRDGVTELVDDLSKPVGVRMYTPGSQAFRKAQADIVTGTLKTGIKNMTGGSSEANAVELVAQTTYELINFNDEQEAYKPTVDEMREILVNPEYIALREQLADEQSDLGNASRARTKA